MENENSYQQNLVLEQKYKLMEKSLEANRALDDKANALLQVGGVVVGLVAAFNLSDMALLVRGPNTIGIPIVSQVAIGLAFVLFLWSIWVYRSSQLPRAYNLPGSTDWDNIFSKYLYASPVECFDKVLSDLLDSVDTMTTLNGAKATEVQRLSNLLFVQVVFVAISVLFG